MLWRDRARISEDKGQGDLYSFAKSVPEIAHCRSLPLLICPAPPVAMTAPKKNKPAWAFFVSLSSHLTLPARAGRNSSALAQQGWWSWH